VRRERGKRGQGQIIQLKHIVCMYKKVTMKLIFKNLKKLLQPQSPLFKLQSHQEKISKKKNKR
jgi:hypothetical protein